MRKQRNPVIIISEGNKLWITADVIFIISRMIREFPLGITTPASVDPWRETLVTSRLLMASVQKTTKAAQN